MTTPTEIKRTQSNSLSIRWSNGSHSEISALRLRTLCPCADCRQKRGELNHDKPLAATKKSSLKVLSASIDEETTLKSIWAVGNYALGVEWLDGHNAGIYTYDYLAEIGK